MPWPKTDARTLFRYRSKTLICAALSIFFVYGCVGPQPAKEFVLAKAAVEYAEKNGARKYSKGLLYQAQQHLELGTRLMKDREHSDARENFVKAMELAEQAETGARLKRMETGDFGQ